MALHTTPPSELLDRNLSRAATAEVRALIAPLLQELINYGAAALVRCSIRPEGRDENLAILLSYRHVLEMIDGVEVLIGEAASPSAALQLRSAFEAQLALEYITEDDTARRGLAYLVACFVRLRAFYRRLDPATDEGRELHEHAKNEMHPEIAASLGKIPSLAASREDVETHLRLPGWREAHAEYCATKKRLRGRRPEWHALYDGPKTRRDLAEHLKRRVDYDLLYWTWSETTHGTDLVGQVRQMVEGKGVVRRLRYTQELVLVADRAMSVLVDSTKRLLEHFRPNELPQWAEWRRREIDPRRLVIGRLGG